MSRRKSMKSERTGATPGRTGQPTAVFNPDSDLPEPPSGYTYMTTYTWTMQTDSKESSMEIETPRKEREAPQDMSFEPILPVELDSDEDLGIGRYESHHQAVYKRKSCPKSHRLRGKFLAQRGSSQEEKTVCVPEKNTKNEEGEKERDEVFYSMECDSTLYFQGGNQVLNKGLRVKNSTLLDSAQARPAAEVLRNLDLSNIKDKRIAWNSTLLDSSKANNAGDALGKIGLSTVRELETKEVNEMGSVQVHESISTIHKVETTPASKSTSRTPGRPPKKKKEVLTPAKILDLDGEKNKVKLRPRKSSMTKTSTPIGCDIKAQEEGFEGDLSSVKFRNVTGVELDIEESRFVNSGEILTMSEWHLNDNDESVEECDLCYDEDVIPSPRRLGGMVDYELEISGIPEDYLSLDPLEDDVFMSETEK